MNNWTRRRLVIAPVIVMEKFSRYRVSSSSSSPFCSLTSPIHRTLAQAYRQFHSPFTSSPFTHLTQPFLPPVHPHLLAKTTLPFRSLLGLVRTLLVLLFLLLYLALVPPLSVLLVSIPAFLLGTILTSLSLQFLHAAASYPVP